MAGWTYTCSVGDAEPSVDLEHILIGQEEKFRLGRNTQHEEQVTEVKTTQHNLVIDENCMKNCIL